MKKMPDTLLIVDLNTTCWESPKDQPPGQKNEIIEISILSLSLRNPVINEPKTIIIKPTTSKISRFCTRITTITQEEVDNGISFKEACQKLIDEMDTQKLPWVSWGDFDKKMLMYQCNDTKTPYIFGAGYWSYGDTFAKLMGLEEEVNLSTAMKLLGLEFVGSKRASDQVIGIATLMAECFRKIRCK